MNIIIKGCNGISLVPIESRLLSERKVFIEGEITASSACSFVRTIMFLVKEDEEKPIDVYINSPGGSVNDAGLVIYDVLKSVKTEINLHCIGVAGSMAAILMAGGAKGHRFILPHSGIMIHEPFIAGSVGGNASTIMRTAESIMKSKKTIVEMLAKDTGKTKKEIEAAIAFDNFMNAEEAIAFGICDSIETNMIC